ncbi:hypothetical protein PROFUN_05806 [Planoprotostelium fungivorum]|uniref:Ankyrin repeat protein n=1 Tax=Planoprotostelium fungivorum TaxID=1890364 RepID=A0A2P6NQ10_9EUKA|nr:hypothetical protein PROFUN_05806 [Planoprotostelium fungivorum]
MKLRHNEEQFAILRMTCKLWKDIVDSFTDWLTKYDLPLAIERGNIESLRFLSTRNELDPCIEDIQLLIIASTKGSMEIVRLLLSDIRVDPSTQDNEAIRNAVSEGHTETVRLLLSDPRVDPSAQDNYTMVRAVERGYRDRDNFAIRYAAFKDDSETIRLVLSDSRVDPSAGNNEAHQYKTIMPSDTRPNRVMLVEQLRAVTARPYGCCWPNSQKKQILSGLKSQKFKGRKVSAWSDHPPRVERISPTIPFAGSALNLLPKDEDEFAALKQLKAPA